MTTRRLPARLVLLGSQVGGSLSPTFQRAALAAAGIRLSYDALDVAPDHLPAVIELSTDGKDYVEVGRQTTAFTGSSKKRSR